MGKNNDGLGEDYKGSSANQGIAAGENG